MSEGEFIFNLYLLVIVPVYAYDVIRAIWNCFFILEVTIGNYMLLCLLSR